MIGIDPGPEKSAYVSYELGCVVDCGIVPNARLRQSIIDEWPTGCLTGIIAIEWVESFGMPVGKDVFETVYWIGRFAEAALRSGRGVRRIGRKAIKLELCGSARAKDANIRQALIDRFPASGGGKTPQVGTKNQRGPLYGVSSHCWSALAVAVVYEETMKQQCAS